MLCYRNLPVLILPRLVIAVEWHTKTEPQLALYNLGSSLRTIRVATSGGASRSHVSFVAAHVSKTFTTGRLTLPCSIEDFSTITLRNLGQLVVDALKGLVHNVAILISLAHLLLCV
jgi:hypothetical protein